MKIKCTLVFKYRKFIAESDDDLQNMTEVEAVSDIFSAISYITEDIYAMEPKEKEIKKHIKWKVEYGDILVFSSDNIENDDLAWSDRIRYVVYSIIKAEYKSQQTNSNDQQRTFQQLPYVYQTYQPMIGAFNSRVGLNTPMQGYQPHPFINSMTLMEQLLDEDMFEEYKKRKIEEKKLNNILSELENLEKYRKLRNKTNDGGKEKPDDPH